MLPLKIRLIFILFGFCGIAYSNSIDSLSIELNQINSRSEKIKKLTDWVEEFTKTNPSDAVELSNILEELLSGHHQKNDSLYAEAYYRIGAAHGSVLSCDEAFSYLDQGLFYAENANHQTVISNIYNSRGYCYFNIGDYTNAVTWYQKSLTIAEQTEDVMTILKPTNNIGILYLQLRENEKAIEYFKKTFDLSRSIEFDMGCAVAASNLGALFFDEKEYDKAIEYLETACTYSAKMDSKYGLLMCNSKMANVHEALKNRELALQYNQLAYDLAKELDLPKELASVTYSMARMERDANNHSAAIVGGKKALKLYQKVHSINDISNVYKFLSDNYAALGNSEKSLGFLQLHMTLREQVFSDEKVKTFSELEAKYETSKKIAENEYLRSEKAKNETIIRQRTMISIFAGVGLLLFGALAFLIFQKYREKEDQNKLLEVKVKQRTKHLQRSNERLKTAHEELNRIAWLSTNSLKDPLRNIAYLSSNLKSDLNNGDFRNIETSLDYIENNAQKMYSLTSDVLEFTKPSKSLDEYSQIKLIDVPDMLKTELATLVTSKNASIIFDTQELYDRAERAYITTPVFVVIKHLTENGIKFNHSERPVIRIAYSEYGGNKVFTVRDNGIGIPEEYHESVFEIFEQIPTTEKVRGTGMGLPICRKIINSLEGSIRIVDANTTGTTIEFSYPIVVAQPVEN